MVIVNHPGVHILWGSKLSISLGIVKSAPRYRIPLRFTVDIRLLVAYIALGLSIGWVWVEAAHSLPLY